MNIKVQTNYEEMSKVTAEFIINYVNHKPDSLLCLAGGHTPLRTFDYLIEAAINRQVDFSECKFVGLDEWVGLGKSVKGSCQETLYTSLFDRISISEEQICFFNGLAEDTAVECKRVDHFIFENGKIDVILLGIGMNGHLGFNEPNVSPDLYSHVVGLDPVTKDVSSKYFEEEVNVKQGISLGIQHIVESDTVILIANGAKKADIVKQTVEGEKTVEVPSSLVQDLPNVHFFIDEEAASLLEKSDKE
ncbi:glucosamine-6-phosphate deaminase [Peribacillus loiseleuriae]|uniref:glucosamine-6-phosphate deaminase n=1 Tax=Peribacillus loiseleuriae TaxID=1679170 RepID=UPI003802326E